MHRRRRHRTPSAAPVQVTTVQLLLDHVRSAVLSAAVRRRPNCNRQLKDGVSARAHPQDHLPVAVPAARNGAWARLCVRARVRVLACLRACVRARPPRTPLALSPLIRCVPWCSLPPTDVVPMVLGRHGRSTWNEAQASQTVSGKAGMLDRDHPLNGEGRLSRCLRPRRPPPAVQLRAPTPPLPAVPWCLRFAVAQHVSTRRPRRFAPPPPFPFP